MLLAAGTALYRYKKDSADGRLLIWCVSSDMARAKPFFGYGIEGFANQYMRFQERYFESYPDSPYAYLADENIYAFNEPLRIYIEQGIIGILFLSGLIISLSRSTTRSNDPTQRGFLSASKSVLCLIFIFGCFSYPSAFFQLNLSSVFFMAIVSSHQKPLLKKSLMLPISTIIILISGVFTFTLYIYPRTKAYREWNTALDEHYFDKTHTVDILERLSPFLEDKRMYLVSYGIILNGAKRYGEAIEKLEKSVFNTPSYEGMLALGISYERAGEYDKAVCAWKRASCMIPSRFKPHYYEFDMYRSHGNIDRARVKASTLLGKKIKTESPDLVWILHEVKTWYRSNGSNE